MNLFGFLLTTPLGIGISVVFCFGIYVGFRKFVLKEDLVLEDEKE